MLIKVDYLEAYEEQNALVCVHIQSQDERMLAQLLEVFQSLSAGSLQLNVPLLRASPLAVQSTCVYDHESNCKNTIKQPCYTVLNHNHKQHVSHEQYQQVN